MYNIVKAQENLLQILLLGLQEDISREKTKGAGSWDSILSDMGQALRCIPRRLYFEDMLWVG